MGAERGKFYEELAADLIAYGEHVFRNARKGADGASEGDHSASAARQWALLGRKDLAAKANPDPPPLRRDLVYLWNWFSEILGGIQPTGMGVTVIAWGDLTAWQREMRVVLSLWEKRVLVRLGNARASIESERMEREMKQRRAEQKRR